MKKYWQLFWHYRKIELMKMMEYRSDFFFWMMVSTMWTIFNYFFYTLIIGHSDNIAGWSYDEVLILLSFFTMIDALTWSVFYPNMEDYVESIFDGSLSKLLILPVNNIFVILNQRITFNNVPRFFIGLIIMIRTVMKMQISVSFSQIALAVLIYLISVIFLYSGWFMLATIAFWVERLSNINQIMPGFRSFYQMPASIYTGVTSVMVTFIFPLGLITTLPSEIILGRVNTFQILYFAIFTLIFAIMAIYFYNLSIKKYSSVGN